MAVVPLTLRRSRADTSSTDEPSISAVEETEAERLLATLRMHDQMLSCLTFVNEQAAILHPDDFDLEPLYASIEMVGEKRAQVAAQLSRVVPDGLSTP